MDSTVLQQLSLCRSMLLQAVAQDQPNHMREYALSIKKLETMLAECSATGRISRSTMQQVATECTNMRSLAVKVASVSSSCTTLRDATSQRCDHILQSSYRGRTSEAAALDMSYAAAQSGLGSDSFSSESDNDEDYRPWRAWFFRNLHAPYPDKLAKPQLLAQVPRTPEQLNTWFTNMRRRSGWTEVFRIYGQSSERAMRKLISDIESPTSHWTVSTEAKDAVARVKEYLQNSSEGSVDARLRQRNEIAKQHQATPSFPSRHGRSLSGGSWSTGSASSLSNGGSPPPPPYAPQPSAYDPFHGSSSPTPSYSSLGSSSNSRHSMMASSMPSRPPSSPSFSSFGSFRQSMQQPSFEPSFQPSAQQPTFQPYSRQFSFQPTFNTFNGSSDTGIGDYKMASPGKSTFTASPATFSRPPSRSARRPSFSGF